MRRNASPAVAASPTMIKIVGRRQELGKPNQFMIIKDEDSDSRGRS
jgi:hypothetical protein